MPQTVTPKPGCKKSLRGWPSLHPGPRHINSLGAIAGCGTAPAPPATSHSHLCTAHGNTPGFPRKRAGPPMPFRRRADSSSSWTDFPAPLKTHQGPALPASGLDREAPPLTKPGLPCSSRNTPARPPERAPSELFKFMPLFCLQTISVRPWESLVSIILSSNH